MRLQQFLSSCAVLFLQGFPCVEGSSLPEVYHRWGGVGKLSTGLRGRPPFFPFSLEARVFFGDFTEPPRVPSATAFLFFIVCSVHIPSQTYL